MARARRDGLATACTLIALLAGSAPAHAVMRVDERCTREDAQFAGPGADEAHRSAASGANAIIAEAAHALPAVTVESRPLPSPAHRALWPVRLIERLDLATRLRAITRLKLVPVFDNARLTIFFGVDRRGIAGLHIQQQDANGLLPMVARDAPPGDPPLLALSPRLP